MKNANYIRTLILIFSFFLTSANAQKDKIDSLRILLKTDKEDTTKITHLNDLGLALMYSNTDTAIILGNQALTLCEKLASGSLKLSGHVQNLFQNKFDFSITIQKSNTLGNLGSYHYLKADYSEALYYYLIALKINEDLLNQTKTLSEKQTVQKKNATRLSNIGLVYWNQADYSKALDYNLKALKIGEELGDIKGIASRLGNIGLIYYEQSDYPKALNYYLKALNISEELGNKFYISTWLGNIGIVYKDQADYPKALDYYLRSLKIDEEIGNKNGISRNLDKIGIVYDNQKDYTKALEYYFNALKIAEEIGDKNHIGNLLGNIGSLYTSIGKFKESEEFLKKALAIFVSINTLKLVMEAQELLSQLYSTTGRFKLAFDSYKKAMVLKDSIFNMESKKQLVRKEMTYQFEKKESAAKAEYEKKIAVREAEGKKEKVIRYWVIGGLVLVMGFLVFVYRSLRITRKQKKIIGEAGEKSEKLLLNILPKNVAMELKATGITTPKYFECVSVLFTDFKEFTILSEQMSAKELVTELHHIFSNFDRICIRNNIEKIKTIGDSYMCVGGIPVENSTHPFDTVNAALEIKQFMYNYKQQRISEGKLFFEIRIGVHTGPVVAGVVGENKFAYDIWGDTVNTASRMESSGEPGKVNISGATYELIKDKFVCEQRGEVEAKNKGVIKMFFVERKII